MARIDVEKKRVTAWPWVVGLVILVGLGWGITVLLAPEPTEPEVAAAEFHEGQPAAVPAPPEEGDLTDAARPAGEVAPFGEDDVGQTVDMEGAVVATGNAGFWLLAGSDVLRVDSDRRVRKGDTLEVSGTLAPADPQRTDEIVSSVLNRHPDAGTFRVIRVVKLVESS